MDNKEIGAILRKSRKNAGITREFVADMIGKSPQMVGHWETGHSAVDANTLFLLCRIYGIDMNDAFGFSEQKEPPVPTEEDGQSEAVAETVTDEDLNRQFAEVWSRLDDGGRFAMACLLETAARKIRATLSSDR